jgi:hypothetical protein
VTGDWHVSVLYLDVVEVHRITYGEPDPLSLDHPVVQTAARLLRMPLPDPGGRT